MNALITIDQPPSRPGPEPILTAELQGLFLASLQLVGNVSVACSKARISRPTAYRARRRCAAFARAWDAALLAARVHAEAELADRAINGVEEAVFYHGEEVARRRRYSDRLLLAHLARLDRLAEREELVAAQGVLDDWVDALQRGEDLPDIAEADEEAGDLPQDTVTGVTGSPSGEEDAAGPCPDCGEACCDPDAQLTSDDCMWLGNRLDRMDAARPKGAFEPHQLTTGEEEDCGVIEMRQLLAYEWGLDEWWLIVTEEELGNALMERDGVSWDEEDGEGAGGGSSPDSHARLG